MEKLRKFETEEEFNNIKDLLEYPSLSYTEDNGKVWVKEKEKSYIIAKYYVSEDDLKSAYGISLFINYYYDFHYMVDYYVVDDGTTVYNTHKSGHGINEYHKFTTSGEHTVYIYTDINKMIEHENGSQGDETPDLLYAFAYNINLISIDFTHFKDSNLITNMNNMFVGCNYLTSITFGDNFDTSNVTSMERMFHCCESLTLLDVSSFDTSNVTNMSSMFHYCPNLTSLDLSNFDTSKVNTMNGMFYDCISLTSITFGDDFNTSNVTDMSDMFGYCNGLTSLDLSSFNTSAVTNMSYMFSDCNNLTSLNLSNWDISNVTNGECAFWCVNESSVIGIDPTLGIFACPQ